MRISDEVWQELAQIQSLVGKRPSAELSARLDKLVEQNREGSEAIPAFEVGKFETQVLSVRKSLQAKPRKFQFKSRLVAQKDTRTEKTHSDAPVLAAPIETGIITTPKNNLDRCIVYEPSVVSTLHINSIRNSIIVLPHITSALYLTSLENCVVITECQQFRLHKSEHVTVFISGCTNPILETSSKISFGHLHGTPWSKISDFAWLQDTPSPNWTTTADSPPEINETKLGTWLKQLETQSPDEIARE